MLSKNNDGGYNIGVGPLDSLCYDLEPRLASLSARNVDVQLVGTFNPLLHWMGGAPDAAFSRYINADTAKAVAADKRLWGMATIAFGDPRNSGRRAAPRGR